MKVKFCHLTYQNLLLFGLLISGAVKPFLTYYNAFFDVTLIFLLGIIMDILFCISIGKKPFIDKIQLSYVGLILAFYAFSAITLLYTASKAYGYEKITFMGIPILGFLYPIFMREFKLELLYKIIKYVIIPVSIWFILFRFLWSSNFPQLDFLIDKSKFSFLRKEYLLLGYLLGISILLAWKFSRNRFNAIAVFLLLILGLGARGALIFTFISIVIFYHKDILDSILNVRLRKSTLKKVVLISMPLVAVFVLFFSKIRMLIRNGLARFSSLIEFASDTSSSERLDQYFAVFEKGFGLQGMTIGYGLGSWGFLYTGTDIKLHPHNILLEAWIELGFFSALFFAFFFFTPFLLKRTMVLKTLALYAFLNAMKSSSFAYDRNLFIIFGMLVFSGIALEKRIA